MTVQTGEKSDVRCVIGIDAGGTALRLSLANAASGDILATVRGAAAPDGGPDPIPSLLSELLDRANLQADTIVAVCAGITKISRAGVREAWESALGANLPSSAAVRIVPDYVIAFHGAVPSGAGVSVVAGTGSVVYGENANGRAVRAGGRGWEYGDEGSGAWLTTEAIRRTLRALDGLEHETPLTQIVVASLGTTEAGALGEAARQRSAVDGRGFLVPGILALARDGDTEASNLFTGAAGWLAAYVRATANRLGFTPETPFDVATAGGMWESGDLILTPFDSVIRRWFPHVRIAPPESPPVAGAVRLARLAAN